MIGQVVAQVAQTAVQAAITAAFPPAGIAMALSGVIGQVVGQAVGEAAQQLCQQNGMPKFIAQEIGDIVKKVLEQLQQQSQADPACEQHVKDQAGSALQDFKNDFIKDIVNGAVENMKGGEKKKGGSWYEALAQALGESLDKQAAKIEELSSQVTNENAKDKPSTMTELQTASQRMSFMMSAADQVLKTIGEALSTMARKQ